MIERCALLWSWSWRVTHWSQCNREAFGFSRELETFSFTEPLVFLCDMSKWDMNIFCVWHKWNIRHTHTHSPHTHLYTTHHTPHTHAPSEVAKFLKSECWMWECCYFECVNNIQHSTLRGISVLGDSQHSTFLGPYIFCLSGEWDIHIQHSTLMRFVVFENSTVLSVKMDINRVVYVILTRKYG